MQFFIRKLLGKFKEYIILIILLLISLSILPLNNKPEVKKIRAYAFGTFALLNNLIFDLGNIFINEEELNEQRKLNAQLMLKLNRLREFGLENFELKRLLEFKPNVDYDLIPSSVISKIVSDEQGIFIINSGEDNGVEESMPVINEKGFVGIVTNTTGNFSLVKTIENSTFKIAATIQRNNIEGVMSWDGINLIMKNIPTTSDINRGDRVVTSNFSTIVPPSIPIGLVVRKDSRISGVLSNVIINPFVNVNDLKNVFVLKVVESHQIDQLELNLLKR